ncbi:MAG: DUF5683 domain-containing protein [Paludibacter sp.]
MTAQIPLVKDTLTNQPVVIVKEQNVALLDTTKLKAFKPDPMRVVWMATILPGYGQILNKKYWKLPIVYGGFLGFAYAISMNSSRYTTYMTAYRDIIDTDPTTVSYIAIIPKGYTIDNYGGISGYTRILKSAEENYRRYRDLSIITAIGYYAITIVDAYVDAQLYDFDISPDLSMRFQPTLLKNKYGIANTLGIQCRFSLK